MTEMLYKAQRSDAERAALYGELREAALKCQRCDLCKTRKNVVVGEGDIASRIMFVGEGPGEVEDNTGRPFVGPAGQLLTSILEAAGFQRDKVYITNIVKCRPPRNRVPAIEEVICCQGWLEAQLALLRPQIIVCLGNTPLKWFIHSTEGITKMRGRWFNWRGAALMPMFHPSYLLRNESRTKSSPKYLTWQDIQQIHSRYESLRRGS
ncbi:MAG: uracil-DNA glycosylase [Pyramidobacter sp.]|jgi:uracil-DNA glycosylase family 4